MRRWMIVPLAALVLTAGAVACSSGDEIVTTGAESVYAKAQAGDMNEVGAAIRRGFDVNEPDENGKTVLHYAIEGNHPQLVEMLLEEFRANVQAPDSTGRTPMDYAQALGNPQILQMLQDR